MMSVEQGSNSCMAAGLKVHESAHWPASSEEGGSSKDSMLAQADQLLSEGQLSAAAAMLRTAVTGKLSALVPRSHASICSGQSTGRQQSHRDLNSDEKMSSYCSWVRLWQSR